MNSIGSDLKDVENMIKPIENAKRARFLKIQCVDEKKATIQMSKELYDLALTHLSKDLIIVEECNFNYVTE